jgi:hypothetical protein
MAAKIGSHVQLVLDRIARRERNARRHGGAGSRSSGDGKLLRVAPVVAMS